MSDIEQARSKRLVTYFLTILNNQIAFLPRVQSTGNILSDITEPKAEVETVNDISMAKELLQRLNIDQTVSKKVQIPDVLKLQAGVMRDTHVIQGRGSHWN